MDHYLHDDPGMEPSWGPWFSHEYITYFSVQPVEGVMALPPVPVTRNSDGADPHWPLGPRHVDLFKENFRPARRLDPFRSYVYGHRNGDFSDSPPDGGSIEPWKVLVLYSTEPDLYLDCDLLLDGKQKITGGSHGWRHMQFRILGMRFGMGRESFLHQREMAARAFREGHDYWGWRYLSRCTHYLADLGNPFHVSVVPAELLLRHLFSRRRLLLKLTAAHHGYEVFVERRFREGQPSFREALMYGAAEGRDCSDDPIAMLDSYMQRAHRRMKPILHYFLDQFGKELVDVFMTMDHGSDVDASEQTKLCSGKAADVIFSDRHRSSLSFLDRATDEIFIDVGRMLGSLINGFAPLQR
ncbi:MAG: hypothetical protein JXA20_08940 [Spirochaetes bacterium]|nr:hypothetical protein [Spirochaetota bacterium]